MINIRSFTNEGNEKFLEYIQNLKTNKIFSKPDLNLEIYSVEFSPIIGIEEFKEFKTRLEFGQYLTNIFISKGIKRNDLIGKNEGLWNWLTYLYFDQFCPLQNGKRNIRETARYLCSSDYTDYFRHYVANAYDIYSLHGLELSKIFLYSPMHEISDLVEVFAAKQDIISNKNVVEVIYRLYWDKSTDSHKRGISTRIGGDPRRLNKVINQLDLTYDIYNMNSDEIIKHLPNEFDKWKNI
jgi:hypothetical protein